MPRTKFPFKTSGIVHESGRYVFASFCRLVTALLLFVDFSCTANAPFLLPPLLGPYSVGTQRVQIVDRERLDPFAPTCQHRALVLAVWYPIATNNSLDPAYWLHSNAALIEDAEFGVPPETLESIVTQTSINGSAIFPLATNKTLPVLVFFPGSQGLCAMYTSILSSLASYGYTVIGVDHPYDSWPLERPNSEVVMYGNTTNNISLASIVRREDFLFWEANWGSRIYISSFPERFSMA